MLMILTSSYTFYHKNLALHFFSKIEFSSEQRKIFAWFFWNIILLFELKKGWNFCRKRFSSHRVRALTKFKISSYILAWTSFFFNFVQIFMLTKLMKQLSFPCQIISPSFLFHMRSNLYQWNFLKPRANDFNLALRKNEKVS